MTAVDKAKRVARWIAERPPRTLLITGWVVFILGSYPGYMSFDSTMQLYDVRNRIYTDAHAPVMTALWGLLEWVVAGPLPMLVLQSGLFLFGLAAVLRTITSPRAAAVTAVALLLFPPVFAPMAVIWRDSLMAGALLGAAGAALQHTNRWRAVAAVLLVIACSCRPAIALAILPIVVLAIPHQIWWRRAVLAVAATIAIAATARIADWALTDKTTYTASQSLRMVDVVGTLRRASVSDEARLRESLQGLPIASETELVERVTRYRTAYDWWSLAHGEKRIFEPIETDEQNDALRAAWWRVIADYPGAYVTHRLGIARRLVGMVKQKTLDEALTPYILNDHTRSYYGFGWEIDPKSPFGKMVYHTGDNPGYKTIIVRFIEDNKTIIVLNNNYHEDQMRIVEAATLALGKW